MPDSTTPNTFNYGPFSFTSKQEVIEKSIRYWNPDKTRFWQKAGVDLVIDRREGYCLWDMSGRRLIDLHINGGTYNLGHRHPELVDTLKQALDHFDIGNHWFPSVARAALSEKLVNLCPGLSYVVFGSGGAEAVDIALKSARYATKRRKIVSIIKGYHGHSGLSVATGDDRFTKIFLADRPDEFSAVPFNDIDAMERALKGNDVAALIMESIPATYGFPMPREGYLQACVALCKKFGAMYIADEVQTGLMRTGQMWGWQAYGIQPDIMVTAKGFGGGLYPISAAVLNEQAGGWLHEDGAAHISTTAGAELGCVVAYKVLEILQRPELKTNVAMVEEKMSNGLMRLQKANADIFTGIRQKGVILGLEFGETGEGAMAASRALYEHGVWAIFSSLDKRVLQWKPGVLLAAELCDEILRRFEAAVPRMRELLAEKT
jgi:putrescine aminotransferase